MATEYTPAGSTLAFTIPDYADVLDGPAAFTALADDIAAGIETKVGSSTITTITVLTQAVYDALTPKLSTVLYVIVG
jgi:hypothetical protein